MTDSRLILRQVEIGPMANYIYLLGCSETREAAVVDPAWNVPAILQLAAENDVKIQHILVTHGHPDHVNGLGELIEATDARVYLHADEVDYMRDVARIFSMSVEFMIDRSVNFRPVADDQLISVGKLNVRVLHTPGHTPGSQCFLVNENLLSGDTLFIDSCGRVDLPGSDPEKMWWSLNHRLAAVDDDATLYPGHNYADRATDTMVGQRRTNPTMKFPSVESFVQAMRGF
jgi:glyoxylase-like metal-dependent hydrolase (beta-lactamase superfamily II)